MRLVEVVKFCLIGVCLLGFGALLVSIDPASFEEPARPPAHTRIFNTAKFLDDLNLYRTWSGESSLQTDSALNSAARKHAEWCLKTGTLGHEGPNGQTFADRARQAGYGGRPVTENFAFFASEPTYRELLDAWKSSPGHDAGLKMPATDCGIWVTEGSPSYCVWISGIRPVGASIGANPPQQQPTGVAP